jgi:hypothetical protein
MLTNERLERIRARYGAARCDATILLAEIDRLRAIEADYHRLLLDHLRVMKHYDDLYDAGGMKACADLMRRMEELGLFTIVVNGPENRIMGRLTPEGEKVLRCGE